MFLRRYARSGLMVVGFWIGLVSTQSFAIAYTGNEWRNVSQAQRTAYVAGVMDAWSNVAGVTRFIKERDPNSNFDAFERTFTRVTDCSGGRMTYGQVYAIVEKYMNQNPEIWDQSMAGIIWGAMFGACGAR